MHGLSRQVSKVNVLAHAFVCASKTYIYIYICFLKCFVCLFTAMMDLGGLDNDTNVLSGKEMIDSINIRSLVGEQDLRSLSVYAHPIANFVR